MLAGGLAPFIATALLSVDHNASWPIAIYVVAMAFISVISSYLAPETKLVVGAEVVAVDELVGTFTAGLSTAPLPHLTDADEVGAPLTSPLCPR